MHLLTLLALSLTPLPTFALDIIATYNIANPSRFDATLSDTANNVTCSVSYEDTSSLLIADEAGYLSSPVAMVLACSEWDYVATMKVKGKAVSGILERKGEGVMWESTGVLELPDGEVVVTGYGL
ncbi:hypothetical protein CJF32_00003217 [Rutstroemia sp. NJR-2017a WRK4]|nr:hypothetical protein CJF32_00003217 [Rutstroemia sp. NJR-2017a WRK4]